MNSTELALIEKIAQLNEEQQEQLLAFACQLTEETPLPTFDLAAWLADPQRLRAEQRRLYGGRPLQFASRP